MPSWEERRESAARRLKGLHRRQHIFGAFQWVSFSMAVGVLAWDTVEWLRIGEWNATTPIGLLGNPTIGLSWVGMQKLIEWGGGVHISLYLFALFLLFAFAKPTGPQFDYAERRLNDAERRLHERREWDLDER